MPTSAFPLAFRTDKVLYAVVVGPVFGFMVFCSFGQNIGQSFSEVVIITHFAFRARRAKEASRLEIVGLQTAGHRVQLSGLYHPPATDLFSSETQKGNQ